MTAKKMLTEEIDRIDINHSWHPFSQMNEYLAQPRLHIERGEGCWLYDTDGKRYLDANASIWTNVHGHNDPELNQAIIEQTHKIAHCTHLGLSNPTAAKLIEKLIQISPENLQKVFFSDNGSNSVEIALKQSFQYWQLNGHPEKTEVIGLQDAYHGDTFGTMAVGDCGIFHERFAHWMFPVHRLQRPICQEAAGKIAEEDDSQSIAQLETLLRTSANRIACCIIEPWVQGAGGMLLQPRSYIKKVAELCKAYNVHLIVDEVFVGFGRLGHMLICNEMDIKPDFLCLAKGLTAGYLPLAVTLTSQHIFDAFLGNIDEYKAFYHGHTFTANPLGAAVALKSIEKLEQHIASGALEETIGTFSKKIQEYCIGSPLFPELRQRGMTASIALPKGFPTNQRIGMQVCIAARKYGLILRPLGDTILVVPPLTITPEEMDFLFKNLIKATDEILSSLRNA